MFCVEQASWFQVQIAVHELSERTLQGVVIVQQAEEGGLNSRFPLSKVRGSSRTGQSCRGSVPMLCEFQCALQETKPRRTSLCQPRMKFGRVKISFGEAEHPGRMSALSRLRLLAACAATTRLGKNSLSILPHSIHCTVCIPHTSSPGLPSTPSKSLVQCLRIVLIESTWLP